MTHRAIMLGVVSAFTFAGARVEAAIFTYGDAMNLQAPTVNADSSTVDVAVRGSDANIWVRQLEPTYGSWHSIGSPSGGAASGPASAYLGGQPYYIVRGANGTLYYGTGYSWSAAFGAPSGGAGSAPQMASVGAAPNTVMQVVVLDNNNNVWTRQRDYWGNFGSWTQVGQYPTFGVPGIALSQSYAPNIFSLDVYEDSIYTRCTYGNCYQTWNYYGSGLGHSGSSATSYVFQGSSYRVSVALLGLDNKPWVATSTDDGSSFGNFVSLGGSNADSSPGIAYFSASARNIIAVHRPDGNYWVYNFPAGVWTNIGHP